MTHPTALQHGTVKICSLGEVAHAEFVVAAGADLFGLNFTAARRKVSVEMARAIASEVRALTGPEGLPAVGVFVDQPADEINRIADLVGLDIVQLHGSESPELAAKVERPIIRAFRSRPGLTTSEIDAHLAEMPLACLAALIDGYHPTESGGSGTVADWSLAAGAARRHPVILAGGLTPENVAVATRTVHPLGVDVSSGVEVDGRKDRERIIRFVAEARRGFASLGQANESS